MFAAIRPLDPERVVFGQYEGYRDEDGVADDSETETFVAAEVFVDTWRWSGVPFYLRTGKSMAEGRRTVTIGFTEAPLRMFPEHDPDKPVRPSELIFELSDDPQVRIEVEAKVPGPADRDRTGGPETSTSTRRSAARTASRPTSACCTT